MEYTIQHIHLQRTHTFLVQINKPDTCFLSAETKHVQAACFVHSNLNINAETKLVKIQQFAGFSQKLAERAIDEREITIIPAIIDFLATWGQR